MKIINFCYKILLFIVIFIIRTIGIIGRFIVECSMIILGLVDSIFVALYYIKEIKSFPKIIKSIYNTFKEIKK